jgi:CxxC motif-containing protein (DUF1111 family)
MRLAAVALSLTGSLITVTAVGDRPPLFGDHLPGLTQSQINAFGDGRDDFADVETVADGLGPVFNGRSCGECHSVPVIGGGSTRTVTRFGQYVDGVFDPMVYAGGSLVQDHAIGPDDVSGIHQFLADVVPSAAGVFSVHRRTTPLFGLGLVDAVPDADFVALAAAEAARNDGTSGRVSVVVDLIHGGTSVGKFGWKAQVPSLHQFSGDAYLNEMGITNPVFPNENCPQGDCTELAFNPVPALNDDGHGVINFTNFMTMLDAPPRGAISGDTVAGEKIFESIGCGSCHVANLQTGSSEIAALRDRPFHPYSDFLLHDMGALGDNIAQGAASGREMRTAPLWGLRMITTLLHDGRATSIEDAILAHDGQGKAARDRFAALGDAARARLLAFLNSL